MKTLRLPDKEASYIYKWISMKVFLLVFNLGIISVKKVVYIFRNPYHKS